MCGVPFVLVPFHSTMRTCQVIVCALALFLLAVEAKKAPREKEAESWSHNSKKYSKDHQKPHHFEHKKEVLEENEADPRAKQAPLEVPEPEIELQGHLEKSHKVLAEENEKDLHLQDLAYEESLEKRHRKQEVKKEKSGTQAEKSGTQAEKKLFADQEEAGLHAVDEKVIEDSFEPLEQQQQEKPKKNKKQKEEKKKHKEEKKHNKKAHEKKSKDKQKQKEGKKNGKKYNKKEHKKH